MILFEQNIQLGLCVFLGELKQLFAFGGEHKHRTPFTYNIDYLRKRFRIADVAIFNVVDANRRCVENGRPYRR